MRMDARNAMAGIAVLCMASCAVAGRVVYSTGFDTPDEAKGWTCNSVWKIEDGAGVGGSKAMVWTNSDGGKYVICNFPLQNAKAGQSYRARFKVKADRLEGGGANGTICWMDANQWLGGAGGTVLKWGDRRLKPDADGWCEMCVHTTPFLPPRATRFMLQLFVTPGATGRVAFDDVSVELVDERKVGGVFAFTTSCYRNIAAAGDVRFVATTEIPKGAWDAGKVAAELSYRAADGSEKTAKMSVPDMEHAEATLDAGALAMGRHKVTVKIKETDGRVLGEKSLFFERVAELPQRRVWLDAHGRTFIDGKPFFPLGMFWSIGTLENVTNAFDRYASGPFNCLQNYDHTLTVKDLDRFWSKGLRVLVGVKDAFAPIAPNIPNEGGTFRFARPKKGVTLNTWADEDRYLEGLAEAFRDHPGFLGWYGCDEFPERFHDRLKERYELLKRLDPGHPVFFTVTSGDGARKFIDCTDTVGIDAYDIHNKYANPVTKPDFGEAWVGADRTQSVIDRTLGTLRIWQVPQAFANNWDHKGKRPELGFPTFKELKSQAWQEIAVGANGLFFYSYSQILNCRESDEAKEEYFRRTCSVAKEIREQIPVLTLEPGPAVAAKPERVRVRTWRDGDAVYALVCNSRPEPRTGTVRIEGRWASARTVFGEGVTFADGALSLDMPNLGVAIVRLERVADSRPIGVFDSGTGGLTVLERLLAIDSFDNASGERRPDGVPDLARESFVYFGDQANMPYGMYDAEGKADFLRELVVRDARFVLGDEGHEPSKIVVIACNTATAYGLDAATEEARPKGVKVIGVVNAGVAAAMDALDVRKGMPPFAVGVLATPGTIASGVYDRTLRAELSARGVEGFSIVNRGGVGLAEAVENDEPGMADCARTNLVALVEAHRAAGGKAPLKAIILGCTHYPFVLSVFKKTLAELRADPANAGLVADDLVFIDPAVYTAEQCFQTLRESGRMNLDRKRPQCVKAFISVGRDGPLPHKVKYGRKVGQKDIGTKIVPMDAGSMPPDAVERISSLLPLSSKAIFRRP